MAYNIRQFGAVLIPEYLDDGDEQNMGTGEALTNFQQLPNGTFYDHYGDRRSPQGIRPITKSGLIWGEDAYEIKDTLIQLRKMLGVRDRLTVAFDDGTLWWQTARLKTANLPRPMEAVANWLPFQLEWVTAAQHWYRLVHRPQAWRVGDGSFRIGDGSAGLGQAGQSAQIVLPGLVTMTLGHAGSIPATNLRIEVVATHAAITPPLVIANTMTGHVINFLGTINLGQTLIIDCGEMDAIKGAVAPYADAYGDLSVSNRAEWMALAPESNNVIEVAANSGSSGLVGLISFYWHDHYA